MAVSLAVVEASRPEGLSDAALDVGDRISRLDRLMAAPLIGEFPDTVILPPAGVPNVSLPLEPGDLPPVARPTPPIVIPYPSVDLGPAGDRVNVPVGK